MQKPLKNQSLRRSSTCVWALVCLLGVGNVWAESYNFERDKYRFSGFATLGATKGGSNNLGFRRNVSQDGQFNGHWSLEPDSLLGVQVDADFTPKLAGAVQVVVRDRASNKDSDIVEWAYLRYRFNPSFTVRAGRIGLDLFLLSEYRNLGFAYLWSRPPVEFYGPISFDYYDGLDLTYKRPLGEGLLELRAFGGKTQNVFAAQGFDVEHVLDPAYGISIGWESAHWRAKLALLKADFSDKMQEEFGSNFFIDAIDVALTNIEGTPIVWPEATQIREDISVRGTGLDYASIGLAYDNAPWVIQAETAYIESDFEVYQTFINSYLSVGYRIGPTTVYAMAAQAENQQSRDIVPEPEIDTLSTLGPLPQLVQDAIIATSQPALDALLQLQSALQITYDAPKIDQKTFTLGMRWDIRYDLALKLQLDRTHVQAYQAALFDSQGMQTRDEVLDTYTINLNYVF